MSIFRTPYRTYAAPSPHRVSSHCDSFRLRLRLSGSDSIAQVPRNQLDPRITVVYACSMKRSQHGPNSGMAIVFVVVLTLADPLLAKCPKHSVEVRGKIECSFEPDYKVLVTLIYNERQREASGEETAMNIHDGSFNGKVAFSTFISYNPLTGHSCGRLPKSVLVRLIAADGTEWDRKELKIADAFSYDEEHGQYTVLSNLTLHGWCRPKCGETPSTPCGNPK